MQLMQKRPIFCAASAAESIKLVEFEKKSGKTLLIFQVCLSSMPGKYRDLRECILQEKKEVCFY